MDQAALQAHRAASLLSLDAPRSASRSVVVAVLAGCAAVAVISVPAIAFGSVQLPVLPGFTWGYATAYLIVDAITVVLLAQQRLVAVSRSVAVLTAAYAYSGVAATAFLLAFPGTFDSGVLLGGPQSSIWIFYLWRIGFSALVALSSFLVLRPGRRPEGGRHTTAVWLLVGLVLALAVSAVAIGAADRLPVLIVPGPPDTLTTGFRVVSVLSIAVSAAAVAVTAWAARQGSRLRVWLVMVTVLVLADAAIQLPATGRYTLGWYVPRVLGVIGAATLLAGLIAQVARQSKALVAARAESDRLARIVEQSPLGYFLIDGDMRVRDVNAALCEMTGFTREELLGVRLDRLPDLGGEEDSATVVGRLLGSGAGSVTLRTRIPRRDGSTLWVTVVAHRIVGDDAMHDAIAGSVADASGEVAAETDAQAPVGLALLAPDGSVTHVNEALCVLTGQDRRHLVGAVFADLLDPEDRAEGRRQEELLRSGDEESTSAECRLATPARTWVSTYRSASRSPDGRLTGMTVQVIDVSARRQAEETAERAIAFLEQRSTYDGLTGLLNRATLADRLQSALDYADGDTVMAVLLCDVDRFQQVSNAMSRVQGDAVLVDIGHHVQAIGGDRSLVARTGGDEFALAVPVRDAQEARALAERVLDETSQRTYGTADHPVHLTASVGLTLGGAGSSAADLLQEADLAARQAKALGRRSFAAFDREMRTDLLARVDLTERIRSGLAQDQFHAWYQPIVSLADRRLTGYEALSRWIAPDGVVPPDRYLPIAEDTGLIIEVGARSVDEAIDQLALLPAPLTVAVNASPTQLLSGDLSDRISSALARNRIDPTRLVVEITEQALFDARRADDAHLGLLADLGVGLHVDDFGTGYSSITHIRDFPITGIKLDRTFTAEVDQPRGRAVEIAGVLGELAQRLDLVAVAEGIETEEQAVRVAELGWSLGQGWLFGRPAPLGPGPEDQARP